MFYKRTACVVSFVFCAFQVLMGCSKEFSPTINNNGSGAQGGAAGSAHSGSAGIAGTAGTAGMGGCIGPEDCPGMDSTCAMRTCEDSICGIQFAAKGTETPEQDVGDCQKKVCDDDGNIVLENDDTDLPGDDGDNCTNEICMDGTPLHPPRCVGQHPVCNDGVCETLCDTGLLMDGPEGQSCKGLPATCGATGDESCCRSLKVPGNTVGSGCEGQVFYRDNDAAADQYNTTAYPATITDYYLDRFEVTVGRFKRFVATYDTWHVNQGHPLPGEGNHPHVYNDTGWDSAWSIGNCFGDTITCLPSNAAEFKSSVRLKGDIAYQSWPSDDLSTENDNRPINYVNWFEAFAFCVWDGGFLPTEAEWMYASSGGNEQRAYPWSNPPSSTMVDATCAGYHDGIVYTGCNSSSFSIQCIANVGKKPAGNGRWGHSDLSGNLWEWNADGYQETMLESCENCLQNTPATSRVSRGGGYGSDVARLRSAYRGGGSPTNRGDGTGFRCGRVN